MIHLIFFSHFNEFETLKPLKYPQLETFLSQAKGPKGGVSVASLRAEAPEFVPSWE